MRSEAKTVSEYVRELPENRRTAIVRLSGMIRRAAPRAIETMDYGMPSYSLEGVPMFALASQKGYMALYVCDTDLVKKWKPRLGNLDCGKSCIRFKSFETLPLDAVASIIGEAIARHREHATTRAKAAR